MKKLLTLATMVVLAGCSGMGMHNTSSGTSGSSGSIGTGGSISSIGSGSKSVPHHDTYYSNVQYLR